MATLARCVDNYPDHYLIGSATEPPYRFDELVSNGRHLVRAVAYDNYCGDHMIFALSDFQIGAALPVNLLRGPYLQSGVVYRHVGSLAQRIGQRTASSGMARFIRSGICVTINGARTTMRFVWWIAPDTAYDYAIGFSQTLAGATNLFRTAPTHASR